MPHHKLTHEENRSKVCAVCYCKSGSKANRKVSDKLELAIKDLVFKDYDKKDTKFPSGLCSDCYFNLMDATHGHSLQNRNTPPRQLLIPDPEVYDIELQRLTRSSSGVQCQCIICAIARLNGLQWKKFMADCKKVTMSSSVSPSIKYDRLCKQCLAPIYRGSNHSETSCNSKRMALQNVTKAINNSNTSMDLVTSKFIKSKTADFGSESVQLRSDTGGHPITVSIGKLNTKTVQQLTSEEVKVMQIEANLSDNQVEKIVKNLRLNFGRKIAQPGLRETMVSDKTLFDPYFTADEIQFIDSDDNPLVRPFVYCCDITGFVSALAELRGFSVSDLSLKVGLDGGKGHLKMILTMYEPDRVLDNKVARSRVTREAGIGSGESYSLLGRKKVMILAIAPDTPENYTNLQMFYDMVRINKLEYKQTGDFKALNLLLGLMSCSSQYGCCYCEAKRSSDEWSDGGARLRSADSLCENADNFKKLGGGDRSKAKNISTNSVENPIVFDSEDDGSTPVLLKCPPPALHLKLSLNNILMDLNKVWPPILEWLSHMHIILEPYHGGRTLEGNDCSKVLRNLEKLEEILPGDFSAFMDTLKAFRDIVDTCFGFSLDPNFKQVCAKFSSQFKKLHDEFNLSMPNKIHVIADHVMEFCDIVGKGDRKCSFLL